MQQVKKVTWQNIGTSPFYHGKMVIAPGATFQATETEIPKAFRDLLEIVQDAEVIESKTTEIQVNPEMDITVVPIGKGFNVIKNGVKMNQRILSLENANKLAEELKPKQDEKSE